MAAIWHASPYVSIFSPPPSFSFQDVAEIIAPSPESYAEARENMQAWERKMGAVWFQTIAQQARANWDRKRPWWLT